MNRKIPRHAYRIVAAVMLASIPAFAFVWTRPPASQQTTADATRQTASVAAKINSPIDAPEAITLRAEKRGFPLINLQNGKKFEARFVAPDGAATDSFAASGAQPRAMIEGDLNADGAADLIVGYASGDGGRIAVYQGSPDTLGATTPEVFEGFQNGRFPAPFLSEASLFNLPVAADFIGAGDFNRDGFKDIIAAARGDNKAFLLLGDGKNRFKTTFVELPGRATAMLVGNIDPLDNVPDIAFGVAGENDAASLVLYRGAQDAFGEKPDVYSLPGEITSLALGQLDDNDPQDIAAAAGGKVAIIHGSYPTENETSGNRQVEILDQFADVAAVRVGNFVWDRENRPELALLGNDGAVSILERGALDKRAFTSDDAKKRSIKRLLEARTQESARNSNYQLQRKADFGGEKWTQTDRIQISAPVNSFAAASSAAFFTSARMTPLGTEDLLVVDPSSRKLHVLMANSDELRKTDDSFAASVAGGHVDLALDVESGTTIAALPMRLSVMNRPGLVLLSAESAAPSYSIAAPVNTFNVTKTADTYGTCVAGNCSFREALKAANANTDSDLINVPAGTYTIDPALGNPDNDTAIDPAAQQSGDWDVFYDTTITGAGQASTILQAGATTATGHDRVLDAIQNGVGIPDLTLSGVTIKNGRCRADIPCVDGGGLRYAVDNLSVLTINNSTFDSNRTEVNTANPAQNGGGIDAGQSDVNLTSVTVTNNVNSFVQSGCTGATQCGGEGGGIFAGISYPANPTAVTMNGCIVNGNTANSTNGLGGRGGAYAGSPDSVSVTNGTFNNNVATTDGGGFRLFTPTTISGATISNNSARQNGGGIWSDPLANDNTPLTNNFSNLTMKGNTADSDATIAANNVNRGDGGAIFHGRGTLNLSGSTIGGTANGEANTAYNGGGIGHSFAPFLSASFNTATVTINGGSIVGNLANNNGGGVLNDATRTGGTSANALNIGATTAVTLTNNNAKNSGGGVAVITGGGSPAPAASATLTNMTLRSNKADSDNSGAGDGGALFQDLATTGGGTTFAGTLTVGASGFANSAFNGGGIRNNAGTVTIPASASITYNTATGAGGGISNNGTLSALSTPTITNNTASGNGGGIFNSGTLGAITAPAINSNSAANGAGIFTSNGNLTVSNGSISSNIASAAAAGGGILFSGAANSTVTGTTVNSNTGSGIYITANSLDVTNATITGNTADGISVTGTGNGSELISGNTINNNGGLGIDLGDNGVTANDTNDVDGGPNNTQNYPVLNYVKSTGEANLTLNSTASRTFRINYFANTTCDPSGNGEGETALGTQNVTTSATNTVTTNSAALAFGTKKIITATATDTVTGDTSEFSVCRTVNTPPTITAATGVSRQQGSPATNSQIATVTDPDQPLNTLTLTVNGSSSATVNGVTVSGIAVDSSGNVTANIIATCSATNASFTLRATDNATEFAETTLNVTVNANTAPTVGNYANTTINVSSSGTVITPDTAPTDNGSVASVTAAAVGFTGTFSGNTTTGAVTVNNAGPVGTYTVVVTTTDNCGTTTTKQFTLTVNAIPTISAQSGISRQQGSPATNSQIATVNDADQAANTLAVTVRAVGASGSGTGTATVNGVTVSNISVNAAGAVTADVAAACGATNASFTLRVTDSNGAFNEATLNVTVTANAAPTVGNYSNLSLPLNGGAVVTPSSAPADNGTIQSVTATASPNTFSGSFSGDTATGAVTISNAGPVGNYTITVTVTDNCGLTVTKQFTLTVTKFDISGVVKYGTTPSNQATKYVPGVIVSATGASSISSTTDANGAYLISNLLPGGTYTVTPAKTGNVNGVTAFDATLVLRHVASGGQGANALSANQQIAADANNSGSITAYDATLILRFVANNNQSNGQTGETGNWKFVPASRNYANVNASSTNQDYDAFLIGDVNGDWTAAGGFTDQSENSALENFLSNRAAAKAETNGEGTFIFNRREIPAKPQLMLALPENVSAKVGSTIMIPVNFKGGDEEISAFKFDVQFDPTIFQIASQPIETASTEAQSKNCAIAAGSQTESRIGIAGACASNVSGGGTLVYLRFTVIGETKSAAENGVLSFGSDLIFEDNFGRRISVLGVRGQF